MEIAPRSSGVFYLPSFSPLMKAEISNVICSHDELPEWIE